MSRYIYSLLFVFLLFPVAKAQGDSDSTNVGKNSKEKTKVVFSGVFVNVDVLSPANYLINNQLCAEVSIDAGFLERFYPVWETGYTRYIQGNSENYSYSMDGWYNRLGINLNLVKIGNMRGGSVMVGLRYALSTYRYKYENLVIKNPYWGGERVYNDTGYSKGLAGWLEIVFGIRAEVARNFHMGWSARVKLIPWKKEKGAMESHCIAGFGYNNIAWGLSYTLSYRFGGKSSFEKKSVIKEGEEK